MFEEMDKTLLTLSKVHHMSVMEVVGFIELLKDRVMNVTRS